MNRIMEKEERIAKCVELKKSYNCAQAVALGFTDVAGIDEETLAACCSAFGSGMGTMQGTCGALTGAAVIVGLAKPDRAESRKAISNIMTRFQNQNGATQCGLLKGVPTGKILRSCPDCVADAASFLADELALYQGAK